MNILELLYKGFKAIETVETVLSTASAFLENHDEEVTDFLIGVSDAIDSINEEFDEL